MSSNWSGSLQNRLLENKQFVKEIKVGDGVSEYFYSDVHPYEVIAVKDQKHITIRKMDHKAAGPCYTNEWELISNEHNPVYELTKRGKYWYRVYKITSEEMESILSGDDIDQKLALCHIGFDRDVVRKNGKQTKYIKMNISIGHAEYYYDYSF